MSAAHSSSQPDQPGVVADLPAFGSGIEFRPQSKRSKDAVPKSEVADKAKKAGSVVGQLMEQEDLHEDGQVLHAIPWFQLLPDENTDHAFIALV